MTTETLQAVDHKKGYTIANLIAFCANIRYRPKQNIVKKETILILLIYVQKFYVVHIFRPYEQIPKILMFYLSGNHARYKMPPKSSEIAPIWRLGGYICKHLQKEF